MCDCEHECERCALAYIHDATSVAAAILYTIECSVFSPVEFDGVGFWFEIHFE